MQDLLNKKLWCLRSVHQGEVLNGFPRRMCSEEQKLHGNKKQRNWILHLLRPTYAFKIEAGSRD